MIITDKIRKELIGKKLICQGGNTSLTDGKSYKIIKTEFYERNKSKTLVTVLNDLKQECNYALDWFIDEREDIIVYDNIQEYKLSELLKFKEGTKFKDVNSDNILQVTTGENKNISVIKEDKLAPIIFCERWLNTTYIKFDDEAMSFNEVCNVVSNNQFAEFMLKFRDNNFNGTFNKILETLSKYRSSYRALQEGKWYLKENDKKLTLKGFEKSIVGKEAGIVDINLTPLHIGDSVSLYINNRYEGEKVIAGRYEDAFVMGCGGTKIIGGVGKLLSDNFIKIQLFQSYKEFKAGDKVDTIEFIEIK